MGLEGGGSIMLRLTGHAKGSGFIVNVMVSHSAASHERTRVMSD